MSHGLCLASPSTTICVSGVGGGKTLVALNLAARAAEGLGEWKHVCLLSPNVEAAAAGEYALLEGNMSHLHCQTSCYTALESSHVGWGTLEKKCILMAFFVITFDHS